MITYIELRYLFHWSTEENSRKWEKEAESGGREGEEGREVRAIASLLSVTRWRRVTGKVTPTWSSVYLNKKLWGKKKPLWI